MALLGEESKEAGERRAGCKSLYVRGARYANSAAKFWTALVDEVRERFPPGAQIELETCTGGRLSPDQLFPQLELQRELERLADADLEDVLRQTLAQLELTGPPAPVVIRVRDGETELLLQELPADCVDAEIFPFLVTWLLQWSGVADETWNAESVDGSFAALDRGRRMEYRISFRLANRHLSEGLFRRSLALIASVSALA
jgi:hypothetical protein